MAELEEAEMTEECPLAKVVILHETKTRMITFAQLVEKLDELSKAEVLTLKQLIEKKWVEIRRTEIADSVKKSREESATGKTIVLSTPDEIKRYFSIMMTNQE